MEKVIKALIPSEITKSSFVQLSLALPFICFFYIWNSNSHYYIPVINFSFGPELSDIIDIIGIALIYYSTLFVLLFLTHMSSFVAEHKSIYLLPVSSLVLTLLFGSNGGYSDIPLLFAFFSFFFLAFSAMNHFLNNDTSRTMSYVLSWFLGGLLALIFFVASISWHLEQYWFIEVVKSIMEIEEINPESFKIGVIMLALIGYVFGYGSYKIFHMES